MSSATINNWQQRNHLSYQQTSPPTVSQQSNNVTTTAATLPISTLLLNGAKLTSSPGESSSPSSGSCNINSAYTIPTAFLQNTANFIDNRSPINNQLANAYQTYQHNQQLSFSYPPTPPKDLNTTTPATNAQKQSNGPDLKLNKILKVESVLSPESSENEANSNRNQSNSTTKQLQQRDDYKRNIINELSERKNASSNDNELEISDEFSVHNQNQLNTSTSSSICEENDEYDEDDDEVDGDYDENDEDYDNKKSKLKSNYYAWNGVGMASTPTSHQIINKLQLNSNEWLNSQKGYNSTMGYKKDSNDMEHKNGSKKKPIPGMYTTFKLYSLNITIYKNKLSSS